MTSGPLYNRCEGERTISDHTTTPSDSKATERVIRFGNFVFTPTIGELRKSGVKLRLGGQPMRILQLLLEHPGEIVSREELRRQLWPDQTHVDFDHCLNTAINKLRETLGDSADRPRFIQTIPRLGYRWLAPVLHAGFEMATDRAPAAPTAGPKRGRLPAAWLLAAAFTLALLVTLSWPPSRSRLVPGPAPTSLLLTSFGGMETTPAFSPDGQEVAFSWSGDTGGDFDIYVQPIGRSGPRRLTRSPANEFGPAYSPDGRQIAFYRRSGDYAAVYQVSASGNRARRLFSLAFGPPGPDSGGSAGWIPETLSWSPDGRLLAVVDRDSPNGPLRIFLRDIAAQRFHPFSFPPEQSLGDGNPAFSPDGQRVAFVRRTAPHRGDVYVAGLADEGAKLLASCAGNVRGLAWTSDGRRIIFSSDHSGEPRLWSIGVSGGSPEPVAGVSDGPVFPTVAAAGRRLAFASVSDLGYLVRLELSTPSPSVSPQRLIPFPASTPQISPDGRRIAFSSAHSGRSEIWLSDAQGLNPIRLASMATLAGSPRWSPDGSQIAFDSLLPTGWDIYVISSKGGEPRRVTWHEGSDVRPSWSRDGQWLYFGSDRGGTMQIWKIPVTGGAAHQVTFQGGYDAVESPDGKFLFYTRRGLPGLWTVPVNGGEEKLLLPQLQWQNSRNWAVREDGIYFLFCEGLLPTERQCFVRRYRFSTGTVDTVVRLGNVSLKNAGCSLSPGGESLLVVERPAAETDIAMVQNWR